MGKRGGKGQAGRQAPAQSPAHVLLRGDAELLVDSLVNAERHERHMKKQGEQQMGNGAGEPRFGRLLVPYFVEGCTGDNLEADINYDLTDPNIHRQASITNAAHLMQPGGHFVMNGTQASVTTRTVMESAPLPVPSSLIPTSLAPATMDSAQSGGKKANRKKKKDTQEGVHQQQHQPESVTARVLASQNINDIKGNRTVNRKLESPRQQQATGKGAAQPTARWAGPSFSNSPKPESVPLPTATLLQPHAVVHASGSGVGNSHDNVAAASALCRLLNIPSVASQTGGERLSSPA